MKNMFDWYFRPSCLACFHWLRLLRAAAGTVFQHLSAVLCSHPLSRSAPREISVARFDLSQARTNLVSVAIPWQGTSQPLPASEQQGACCSMTWSSHATKQRQASVLGHPMRCGRRSPCVPHRWPTSPCACRGQCSSLSQLNWLDSIRLPLVTKPSWFQSHFQYFSLSIAWSFWILHPFHPFAWTKNWNWSERLADSCVNLISQTGTCWFFRGGSSCFASSVASDRCQARHSLEPEPSKNSPAPALRKLTSWTARRSGQCLQWNQNPRTCFHSIKEIHGDSHPSEVIWWSCRSSLNASRYRAATKSQAYSSPPRNLGSGSPMSLMRAEGSPGGIAQKLPDLRGIFGTAAKPLAGLLGLNCRPWSNGFSSLKAVRIGTVRKCLRPLTPQLSQNQPKLALVGSVRQCSAMNWNNWWGGAAKDLIASSQRPGVYGTNAEYSSRNASRSEAHLLVPADSMLHLRSGGPGSGRSCKGVSGKPPLSLQTCHNRAAACWSLWP